MKHTHISVLWAAALLASCAVGPDFKTPDMALPVTWANAVPPATDEGGLAAWWGRFGDPQLSGLINASFINNPDMASAALAISQAEASLRAAKANLFPTVQSGFGGTNSGGFNASVSHGAWNGSLSASWTPDIWGGTRREAEAAFAEVGSARAAAAATRTALASSVATAYFEWISAKESLRIAQEQLAYQERTYSVVQQKAGVGMSSALDLAESRATIASTRAQIPQYAANIKSCENAIATYLGDTAGHVSLRMPSPSVYNKIPRVPVGLPSELLRRRPDIIKAECDLHRATANVGVGIANLFPRLSLTGGTNATAGSDFAGYFRSAGWSLGASVSQSVFNRVQLNENVNIARLAASSAGQNYRKTTLAAFAEVEECLIDYARLTNQLPEYEAAAAANKQAAELSLRRFSAGESDFLNVAAAERAWLASELNIISARQQIRITLARLCTALGGGWQAGD